MKITLEFDSPKEYFEQLPRFAALMNFSGQFADFKAKPQGDADTQIEDPDLPRIERASDKLTVHTDTVKGKTKEEVGDLINKAYDTAEAMGATKSDKDAESPEQQSDAPVKEKKQPKTSKPEVKDVEVRKGLSELIKSGKRDKVKAILGSFGVVNFTALDPKDYGEVLAKVKEELGDG